ncbi:MAG TPA: lysophospholipid acyltransferase family protein [Ktedonobacteraceae bacterium]|nr:lysophospholipid acyltransferase family protein [Ktedonobacteraceae bacterium]
MYYFFRCAAWLIPRLPRWLLRLLPDLIGPLAWLFAGPARRQATRNMLHVLGPQVRATAAGRRQLRRTVRAMFCSSVGNYLDAFLMPALKPDDILRYISIDNAECLTEALALGKGLILFSAHFGPFEAMTQWFAARGYQVVIPVEKLKDERMLRLIMRLRSSSGVTFVPLGGSAPMRTIIQALRKNQIVLITADRAIEGESVVRDFFGEPARLPIGPVNLSMRTGAPLVGALGWRVSRKHMHGTFSRLTLALSEEERQQAEVVEAALIKQLEQVISAHPEQWVVFAPIWVEPEQATGVS